MTRPMTRGSATTRRRCASATVRRAGGVLAVVGLVIGAGALPAQALPPVPTSSGQYWFGNYRIKEVWATGATGRGITVAVLDTGVRASEPELTGVVLPGTDLRGGDGRTDTDTPRGHGTAIARYIAGQGGGSNDLTGVAPNARILPVTVNDSFSNALSADQSISSGINYAVSHHAKIINLSQAVPAPSCPSDVATAVRNAIAKNVVVVAGVGNLNESGAGPQYPGSCPGVLAIGAVDGSKHAWPDSAPETYTAFAAPGVDMADENLAGESGTSSGTSNSAALVSGVLALVWSKFPTLTNRQVVARLLATVTDDASRPGKDQVAGYGIVRPYQAITTTVPANAPNPFYDALGGTGTPSTGPSGTSSGTSSASSPPSGSSSGPSTGGQSSGASTGPRAASSSSDRGLLVLIVVLAVLVVIAVVVLLVVLSRRRRPPGGPPPGGAGYGRYPPSPPYPPQR